VLALWLSKLQTFVDHSKRIPAIMCDTAYHHEALRKARILQRKKEFEEKQRASAALRDEQVG